MEIHRMLILFLALFVATAPASAQDAIAPTATTSRGDGWPTHLMLGTYMTLNGADLSTTMFLLGSRQGREANPLLAPFADKPVAFGAVKIGIATTTTYLLLRMHKQRPKLAFGLAIAGSVVYAAVVRHNARLIPNTGNYP